MVDINILFLIVCGFFVPGILGVYSDKVKVMEGDAVTLDTGLEVTKTDRIKWFHNNIRIAQINGDLSKICTDVQCNERTERFRDRLQLDHQTGSLTIINITNTDSGEYRLHISSTTNDRIFNVTVIVPMCVKEGDSVTLHTDVKKKQQDRIKWFHNLTRIAQIIEEKSEICTTDQCKERFRDRLELDNQTGSLTIMNTRNTDSGEYKLQIISDSISSDKTVNVSFCGVSAAERYEVKEGESVTLDTFVERKTNDVMTWYFHVTLIIAEITGDESKICTDDQCQDVFRDRLKLNSQTGSLTITHIKMKDAGVYKLKTTRSRFNMRRRRRSISITSEKIFSVSVIDSGLPSGAIAAIVVAVLLVAAAAVVVAVVIKQKKSYAPVNQREEPRDASNQTDQPSDVILRDVKGEQSTAGDQARID